ncbi:predicted protein [Arabidopsis lyrata subsp. lyrata]|uniref:Predicted protein n=1 Tax=Arabidopsis lyrata subsp. lyrata TaxID=81972 RepID=D7L6V0_ARALL|nr:predicted protein [Arabidopsis lyrata subsp. lyrata]
MAQRSGRPEIRKARDRWVDWVEPRNRGGSGSLYRRRSNFPTIGGNYRESEANENRGGSSSRLDKHEPKISTALITFTADEQKVNLLSSSPSSDDAMCLIFTPSPITTPPTRPKPHLQFDENLHLCRPELRRELNRRGYPSSIVVVVVDLVIDLCPQSKIRVCLNLSLPLSHIRIELVHQLIFKRFAYVFIYFLDLVENRIKNWSNCVISSIWFLNFL